jgi:hypothetical protein
MEPLKGWDAGDCHLGAEISAVTYPYHVPPGPRNPSGDFTARHGLDLAFIQLLAFVVQVHVCVWVLPIKSCERWI